jgi:biotin operon repressor
VNADRAFFKAVKMKNQNGWIKLHRQILEWEWYDDINCFRLFTHLILKANHKEKRYKGIVIKAGQIVTSRDLLAEETGLSSQQIRTAITKLKSTNEITSVTSSQGTIIEVVNYEKYQIATNEITEEQPTSNQRATTNKNDKKEKKEIYIPEFSEFLTYAIEKEPLINQVDLKLKYESWVVNEWRDGNGNKISNWKSKLLNTLPYIKKNTNGITPLWEGC